MNLVDVNLLLYATNPRYPEHQRAKVWWEAQLNGSGPVGLSWQTLAAFIRIATNPKIFQQPLSRQQAVEFVDEWLAVPVVRLLEPTPQHWQTFRRLLLTVDPDPGLVSDAFLAALAIDHNCELDSTDSDFQGFPGLRWRNPLTQASRPTS
ncbi:MAG: type II toxin-antitoxin system VapC family toxin [Verrucomicrobia bacterium]|nr:type II toxin-antitoxin system VapC family toxin [Verrucomicrobiota bacterium]